jgi:hypothetical protein
VGFRKSLLLQDHSRHDGQNGPALEAAKKVSIYALELIDEAGADLRRHGSERLPGPTAAGGVFENLS